MAENKTLATIREHFLYLGVQSKAHFFLHVVYCGKRTLELLVEACRGIFEHMLRSKMLEGDGCVVVFNVSTMWEETVVPVEIHHIGAAQTMFRANELAEIFMKLSDRSTNPSQLVAEIVVYAGRAQQCTFRDYPSFARGALIPPAKTPKFEELIYGFGDKALGDL
jgi:hypothetical protein